MDTGRDLVWDAMCTWAGRVNASCRAPDLEVQAVRRRRLLGTVVQEGLWAGNPWTDVFEPVRVQPFGSSRWREIQPVSEAAARIGEFLDRRPDLRGDSSEGGDDAST